MLTIELSSVALSWTEQDLALPHTPEEQIFSGSVVVDHDNTSGFGRAGIAPLVAIYTRVTPDGVQAQAPTRASLRRDPKVFRAADRHGQERWVMVAVEAEQRKLLVYSSDDLVT